MVERDADILPPPSPEHRRVAAGQFEHANRVIASGNHDYGIRLLLSCCKLDPANLTFRQHLRRTQKLKWRNNLRGSLLAWLTTLPARARVRSALAARDYVRVLEAGEAVLCKNPWDVSVQKTMAQAAEVLGLLDLAEWTLEQARQTAPDDVSLNRTLAALYERRGKFTQSIALWHHIRKLKPDDAEAMTKVKDLAASETIARGQYESAAYNATHQTEKGKETPASYAPRRKDRGPEEAAAPTDEPVLPAGASPAEQKAARDVAPLLARLKQDPTVAAVYLQIAGIYRKYGLLDRAREMLQQGIDITGNRFELAAELADLDIEPFRQNLALTEERLQENPDEELRRIRVRLLKEINARELDLYRQKSDRYPSEMSHRFELGVRLLRGGQTDEAIKELQAARHDPRLQWRCLMYLGYCFKERHNWRLARRNLEDALQALPVAEESSRKEVLFQLAEGCAEAGDLNAALNYGHELANLDFAYKSIGERLEEWQEKLDQLREGTPRE